MYNVQVIKELKTNLSVQGFLNFLVEESTTRDTSIAS